MTLGNKIAQCRKAMNITQDALAQQLGVSNQAVSKWESDQCCPDVMLLPKIADIFGISMDELFGRETPSREDPKTEDIFEINIDEIFSREIPAAEDPESEQKKSGFEKVFGISLAGLDRKGNQKKRAERQADAPDWPDDNILRVVMYVGRKMVGCGPADQGYEFHYPSNVDGVLSCVSISCGDVDGDVEAAGSVHCGNVGGDVDAGTDVKCGDVDGDVDAGCNVSCGNVGGDVDAGTYVHCDKVGGDVDAGTDVRCGDVGGDVDAGCIVECGDVAGDIDANGPVTIRK